MKDREKVERAIVAYGSACSENNEYDNRTRVLEAKDALWNAIDELLKQSDPGKETER